MISSSRVTGTCTVCISVITSCAASLRRSARRLFTCSTSLSSSRRWARRLWVPSVVWWWRSLRVPSRCARNAQNRYRLTRLAARVQQAALRPPQVVLEVCVSSLVVDQLVKHDGSVLRRPAWVAQLLYLVLNPAACNSRTALSALSRSRACHRACPSACCCWSHLFSLD